MLQYKHYTVLIKTNIIYFETEVKQAVPWITGKKYLCLHLKEKYHTIVYYLNTQLLHIPHCSFKRQNYCKKQSNKSFFQEGALVTAYLQRSTGKVHNKRHDPINITKLYWGLQTDLWVINSPFSGKETENDSCDFLFVAKGIPWRD